MKIEFEGNVVNVINEMRVFLKISESCISIEGSSFKKDIKLPVRNKKKFTEFELDFIRDNYKAKSIIWIAAKLSRKKEAIYTQLVKMYKKGLPRKNNKTKNL